MSIHVLSSDPLRLSHAPTDTHVLASHDGDVWTLRVQHHNAHATLEPFTLELPDGRSVQSRWHSVVVAEDALVARGSATHAAAQVEATLRLSFAHDAEFAQPLVLDWTLHFIDGAVVGAISYPVTLHDLPLDPKLLDLPSIHDGRANYGTGLFPHPDPRVGFAFRADRMGQPALHYSTTDAIWSIFAPSETPEPPIPEQIYSLAAHPLPDNTGMSVTFRYPQHEYGHRGDGSPEAYVAKDTFAAGEHVFAQFAGGSTLHSTVFVLCRPPAAAHDYATPMRFLWRRSADQRLHQTEQTLLTQAGSHIRWFNRRLYNPRIGGGQYESPEGSGTAMLGFVEQSLLMATTTLRYAALSLPHTPLESDREQCLTQAIAAISRWATYGTSPEGLLYPACDHTGYHFGYRNYSDYEQLSIVNDEAFDTIRLATEARGLIAAALSARSSKAMDNADAQQWIETALGVAAWFQQHRLAGGGYAARYHHTGEPLDSYPAGTAAVLALFCDCARVLGERDLLARHQFVNLALDAYDQGLAQLIGEGVFAGGTLDASCPDREAAIAALDAGINMYELTNDEVYLRDARAAADNILSYTLTYPITTFGPDTDAARLGISTRGATIVSPENQHLDPVTPAPALLLYGLYAGDDVAVEAAVAALRWALDGRWAITEADGLKQSEQLLHTRWYYNTFFSQRGNFRRGMPLWGRDDSEHAWPQVVPTAAFLATGQVVVDWRSGRAVGVDGWMVTSADKATDTLVLSLAPTHTLINGTQVVYVRVARAPENSRLTLHDGTNQVVVSDLQLAHGYPLPVSRTGDVTLRISVMPGQ